jgi:hypothetical protein
MASQSSTGVCDDVKNVPTRPRFISFDVFVNEPPARCAPMSIYCIPDQPGNFSIFSYPTNFEYLS